MSNALTAPPREEILALEKISHAFAENSKELPTLVANALSRFPNDPNVLIAAIYNELIQGRGRQANSYIRRMRKKFVDAGDLYLCEAIALALEGNWYQARQLFQRHKLGTRWGLMQVVAPGVPAEWVDPWIERIHNWKPPASKPKAGPGKYRTAAPPAWPPAKPSAAEPEIKPTTSTQAPPPSPVSETSLPEIPRRFRFEDADALAWLDQERSDIAQHFCWSLQLTHLLLARNFDELLCLAHLRDVQHYWYQIETVRKVLKQFHGRVLLADEVGLGKTIEAGMVVKEYALRGMAHRILVLVPPSLVLQWKDEMSGKFGLDFSTSLDPLCREDPQSFWEGDRIIASLATARRPEHAGILETQRFDLVVVDEAHHLKNRKSKNWQLVDRLHTRFMVMLSATPVQNNLVELYNLLTLLKPGIFKTESEFRKRYKANKGSRLPANPDQLRLLMRDVMIRNTRALAGVSLPPRHAVTLRLQPSPEEALAYNELSGLVGELSRGEARLNFSLPNLLAAAGSTPVTAARFLERFAENQANPRWTELLARYRSFPSSAKIEALVRLFRENPAEKKLVFVRFRETLEFISTTLDQEQVPHEAFHGGLTAMEKQAAIDRFQHEVPVLLCTESGGEGKNLQFCNTLINFELPWNPQAIEQRIGRLHRIGQTREVFIFNLVTGGTLEESMLELLDEKLNMFELVVGEMQTILGEIEEEQDFSSRIFHSWIAATKADRTQALQELEQELLTAQMRYRKVTELDSALFGEELGVL